MQNRTDIQTHEHIHQLVHGFYDKVRADALLGPVFNDRIQDKWPEHLEKMVRFWQTVLLGIHTYNGSPFPPHAQLPVHGAHFDRWMELFTATVDEYFEGPIATEAKWRAARMAEMFESKIRYYQQYGNASIW